MLIGGRPMERAKPEYIVADAQSPNPGTAAPASYPMWLANLRLPGMNSRGVWWDPLGLLEPGFPSQDGPAVLLSCLVLMVGRCVHGPSPAEGRPQTDGGPQIAVGSVR